jgi:hypothetical protein
MALVLLQAPRFPFGFHESTSKVAYAVSSSCWSYLLSSRTNLTFGLASVRSRRSFEAIVESLTQ